MRHINVGLLGLFIGMSCVAAAADEDNTVKNKTGVRTSTTNADMQSRDDADVKLTAEIRRAIVRDKNLSVYAHNVKIVTRQGQVELIGPVRTASEKSIVETLAERTAGKDNVHSSLTIAPTPAH